MAQEDIDGVLGPTQDEIYFIEQSGHAFDKTALVHPEVISHILSQIRVDETTRTSHLMYKDLPLEMQVPSDIYSAQYMSDEAEYLADFIESDHPEAIQPFDFHIDAQYAREPHLEKSILDDLVPLDQHIDYQHDLTRSHEFRHSDYEYDHFTRSKPIFEMHFMQKKVQSDGQPKTGTYQYDDYQAEDEEKEEQDMK